MAFVVKGTNWENVCAGGLLSFYEKIIFHLDEMAPLKKVTLKERDILDKCKKRDALLNEMRKENDPLKKIELTKN